MAAEKELGPIILNGVDDDRAQAKDCVEAIASYLKTNSKVIPLPVKDSLERYGPIHQGLELNQLVTSERARRLLGWRALKPSFIADVGSYYQAWKASKTSL
ncbi:MAG: hypothetical protein ACSNEK_04560 [Parachlamydiaceae bacterium]